MCSPLLRKVSTGLPRIHQYCHGSAGGQVRYEPSLGDGHSGTDEALTSHLFNVAGGVGEPGSGHALPQGAAGEPFSQWGELIAFGVDHNLMLLAVHVCSLPRPIDSTTAAFPCGRLSRTCWCCM